MSATDSSHHANHKVDNPFGKDILLISDPLTFDIKTIPLYHALLVDCSDLKEAVALLRNIRKSNIETISFIPIFLLDIDEQASEEAKLLTDSTLKVIQTESINAAIDAIFRRKNELKPYSSTKNMNKNLIHWMRYYYTRNKPMKPIKAPFTRLGYKYPILSTSYQSESPKQLINAIQEGIELNYLDGTFKDRIHLCAQCYSGFLNYKELDPKTGSANLETENLIHHFICAHVGPESDFNQGDQLICPKCTKTLRHIGVDYDKPSLMYHSLDGDNYFQEPDMKAECMHCNTQNDIQGLFQFDLFEFTLSELG